MSPRKASLYKLLLALVFLGLASCNQVVREDLQNETQNTAIPTPRSSPPLVPTLCPSVTPVRVNLPPQPPSQYIYILVDKSSTFRDHTKLAFSLIARVLPEVMLPGDQLVIAWIGKEPQSIVYFPTGNTTGRVRPVPLPRFPEQPKLKIATPTSGATISPTSALGTPTTTTSGVTTEQQKRTLTASAQFAEATKTASAQIEGATRTTTAIEEQDALERNRYSCDLQKWNQEVLDIMTKWEKDRNDARAEFLKDALPFVNSAMYQIDDESRIYEPIFAATQALQSAILLNKDFREYKLLIFSDMQEKRGDSPGGLRFNFSNINTIIAFYYCDKVQKCLQYEDAWWRFFKDNRANAIHFVPVIDTTPQRIINLLGR